MVSHASAKETCGKQEGNREDMEPRQRFAFECAAGFSDLSDASSSTRLSSSWDSEDLDFTSLGDAMNNNNLDSFDLWSGFDVTQVVRDLPSPTPISPLPVRDFPSPVAPSRVLNPYSQPLWDVSEPTLESEYEAKESPKEVAAPVFLSEGYKPRIRVRAEAVRDFPFPTKWNQTPPSQPVLSDASSEPTLESEYEANEVESELGGYTLGDSMNNNNLDSFDLCSGFGVPLVVRDFPFPTKRAQTPFSPNLVGLAVRDFPFPVPPSRVLNPYSRLLSDVSEPTLESEYEAKESPKKVVDSVGLVDSSETPQHQSMEDTASNFISPIVPLNTTDSTILETKQLSHKLSDAQSDSEEICRKSSLKNPENLPLRRSLRLLKKGPNTTVNPVPKSKAKASMEAAPSLRRSKRIRGSKSNPTRERQANKRIRSKH